MKTYSALVLEVSIVFALGAQAALAQFNIPNIPDILKDRREQPRQKPPAPAESRATESQTTQTQSAPRLTMNDPHFQALSSLAGDIGLYQDRSTKAWRASEAYAGVDGAKCMKTLDDLAAAGVPDSRAIEVRYDAPEYQRGVRTLAEIRKACEHVDRLGKIGAFERWAILAKEDAPNLKSGRFEIAYYQRCIETYDKITKAGVAPTDRVPERKLSSGVWSGTVEEIREQWCDAALSQAKGKTADSEAPYRKVLKNDKLKMVINSPPGHIRTYAVPGGEYSTDAQKLAAASVWFDNASAPSNEIQVCLNAPGKRIFLRRYAFDAQHNLVGNTSREYCGNIPAAAYR